MNPRQELAKLREQIKVARKRLINASRQRRHVANLVKQVQRKLEIAVARSVRIEHKYRGLLKEKERIIQEALNGASK